MFRRLFHPDRFLRAVAGTGPFRDYCRARGLAFDATAEEPGAVDLAARWRAAVAALPEPRRAEIELELAQVNDLAHRDAIYHLIDACAGNGLPSDLIPGEAAQALWFLVHRPEVFQEVFFHEEIAESEAWHHAAGLPGVALDDHAVARAAFEAALGRFFRVSEGTGRFCASRSYRFVAPDCHLFVGFVSDRLRLLDAFSQEGRHRPHRVLPANRVLLAYYPVDGAVLLKGRLRARSKVHALLRSLSRAVLGTPVDERSLGGRFDLDRLLARFDPPLPEGFTMVRLKALELAYPPTKGRRRIRLETNAADTQFAVAEMVEEHVAREELRDRLHVVYAELQARLEVRGRGKNLFVRLWPDRCSLNPTPAAETLRRSLRSWGLEHAPQP